VADLPLHMQVKLLRAIQEKAVRPVGATHEIPVDVRILSATHKNLSELVAGGHFRQDLFYRINVIELRVPSLREHNDDIPALANAILSQLAQQANDNPATLSPEAMQALKGYEFPGNVRELENILERATTLCENGHIGVDDLQLCSNTQKSTPADQPSNNEVASPYGLTPYLDNTEKEAIIKALEQTRYNKTAAARILGITFRALRYRLKKYGIR